MWHGMIPRRRVEQADRPTTWEDHVGLVFRGETFLSIPEVAERLGVARLTVYRWLRGTRRVPNGITLRRVIRDTRTNQTYVSQTVVNRLRQALRHGRPNASRKSPRRR